MENSAKKFSIGIFGVALLCFFLPFVNVSCQGEKVSSYTGFQLVTGTTIEQPNFFGQKEVKKIDGEPLALLAFLATIAGLGLGFWKHKQGVIASAISGGIGVVSLLMLKTKMDSDIMAQGHRVLQIEYTTGFWITLFLFLAAVGLNGFILSQSKKVIEQQG